MRPISAPSGSPAGGTARRRRRPLAAAALVVLAGVLLSACGGVIGSVLATRAALQRAGFTAVSVAPSTDDTVSVGVHVAAAPTDATVVEVALVVWRSLHERFARLDITVAGEGPSLRASPTFAALEGHFGPRNPAWNRTDVAAGLTSVGTAVLAGLVGLLVIAGLVVVIALVASRRRRGRRGPPPGAPPWAPPGNPPGSAPPGSAPPGWVPPGSAPPGWVPPGAGGPGWGPPAGPPPA